MRQTPSGRWWNRPTACKPQACLNALKGPLRVRRSGPFLHLHHGSGGNLGVAVKAVSAGTGRDSHCLPATYVRCMDCVGWPTGQIRSPEVSHSLRSHSRAHGCSVRPPVLGCRLETSARAAPAEAFCLRRHHGSLGRSSADLGAISQSMGGYSLLVYRLQATTGAMMRATQLLVWMFGWLTVSVVIHGLFASYLYLLLGRKSVPAETGDSSPI